MPHKKLFKAHKIPERTDYHILQEETPRRSNGPYKRGQKPILTIPKRDMIETFEDADFRLRASTHYANASTLGLAKGTERAIQKNMADHRVGIYAAQQKKFLKKSTIKTRQMWQFERQYWYVEDF